MKQAIRGSMAISHLSETNGILENPEEHASDEDGPLKFSSAKS